MVRSVFLTQTEIVRATQGVRFAFEAIKHIQQGMPPGCQLQMPKIPSALSESLVAHEILAGKCPVMPAAVHVKGGGKIADLIVDGKRVEVKATGKNAFQFLSMKDVLCDMLVWAYFEETFLATEGEVKLYWFTKPADFVAGKVSMHTLLGRARDNGTVWESIVVI